MLCRLAVRQRILLYHLSDRSTDRLQNSCIYNISKASPINLINVRHAKLLYMVPTDSDSFLVEIILYVL